MDIGNILLRYKGGQALGTLISRLLCLYRFFDLQGRFIAKPCADIDQLCDLAALQGAGGLDLQSPIFKGSIGHREGTAGDSA
ncbi:MAG: hypothetical protein IJ294_03450, partial [Clostridia bacterium]|nr:hypothetical protein [Clostridia bacterium]